MPGRSHAIDHCRESHAFAQVSVQGAVSTPSTYAARTPTVDARVGMGTREHNQAQGICSECSASREETEPTLSTDLHALLSDNRAASYSRLCVDSTKSWSRCARRDVRPDFVNDTSPSHRENKATKARERPISFL